MDIFELQFPRGIHIPMDFGGEEERSGRRLDISLGIPPKRYKELKEATEKVVNEHFNKKEKFLALDAMIQEVGENAKTPAELVFVIYATGVMVEREKTNQSDKKKGNRGGFSGFPGVIISVGSMPMNPSGSQGGGDTGEEPDIEELIRRSKKINGDYNSRNQSDEE